MEAYYRVNSITYRQITATSMPRFSKNSTDIVAGVSFGMGELCKREHGFATS